MGPPRRDRRKPKDRSSISDRSRRRLDRKRRFAEARRLKTLDDLPNDYPDKSRLQERYRRITGDRDRYSESFVKDGRLFLPNVETGSVKWVGLNDVKEGYSKLNNHWIYREGKSIETKHRYLEDPVSIEDLWRKRAGKGLVDYNGPVKMDKRILDRRVDTNKRLNQWMESYLEKGHSLEAAKTKTGQDALNVLKVTLSPLVGISI